MSDQFMLSLFHDGMLVQARNEEGSAWMYRGVIISRDRWAEETGSTWSPRRSDMQPVRLTGYLEPFHGDGLPSVQAVRPQDLRPFPRTR